MSAPGTPAGVPACTMPGGSGCHVVSYFRGPFGGADPSDSFVVGDVPRFQDGGPMSNKQFITAIQTQAAMEALVGAGIENPTLYLSKGSKPLDVASVVMVGNPKTGFPVLTYDKMPFDKSTPVAAVVTTAPSYMNTPADKSVLASFPTGVDLIGPGPGPHGRIGEPGSGPLPDLWYQAHQDSLASGTIGSSSSYSSFSPYASYPAPGPGAVTELAAIGEEEMGTPIGKPTYADALRALKAGHMKDAASMAWSAMQPAKKPDSTSSSAASCKACNGWL